MNRIVLRGKYDFEPSGFFVIRSPLLPWDDLEIWSDSLEGASAAASQLPEALAKDVAKLRERLRAALLRKEIREALFVASPALEGSLEVWLRDSESERGRGLELALVRYYQRMCGRPTPFGLWSGISVGSLAQRTRLELAPLSAYQRHTRPDTEYLCGLITRLQQAPQLRAHLAYRPNSSLYQIGGQFCYTEHRIGGKTPSSAAISVERTGYLSAILKLAEGGAHFQSLAEALVGDEVTRPEAEAYIAELVANQILVPDLTCPVTGTEPLPTLLERLRKCSDAASGTREGLESLRCELALIDQAGLGHLPQRYRDLGRKMEALTQALSAPTEESPANNPLDTISDPMPSSLAGTLFQVDLVKPAVEATLGEAVLTEMARGAELLRRLASHSVSTEMSRFRDAFRARYEDREVPLLEALDEECGIGFSKMPPAHHTRHGEVGGEPSSADGSVQWGDREKWLLRRLSNALSSGESEIVLEPKEFEVTGNIPLPLPDAFAVMATVAAVSNEALDQGRFQIHVQAVVGPSGATLLGRFCHASESLRKLVREHMQNEESLQPDAVFAEIAHLPGARISNVLLRPLLRDYEIPFLGASGIAPERQLAVSDLWLHARADGLVLRSARLGKQVIPRFTHRYNYALSRFPAYRFLCALAEDGVFQGGWDWGPLWQAPFLPRISSGRLVFAPARWNLRGAELRPLRGLTAAEGFQAAQTLRAKRRLPRLTLLQDGDNAMPVDFDNWLSLESFIHLVHQREHATLTELFPDRDQLVLHSPEGRFTHELIVPFVRLPQKPSRVEVTRITISSPEVQGESSQRHKVNGEGAPVSLSDTMEDCQRDNAVFAPGSTWLFVKACCGPATADRLLRDVLPAFIQRLQRRELFNRWFFIRYGDPDWHLRIRFRGRPAVLRNQLLPALEKLFHPYMVSGAVVKWQIDSYRPETRRYGGREGVQLAEEIFQADSETVLTLLQTCTAEDGPEFRRWWLGLCGVDQLLKNLGLDLPEKLALLLQARKELARVCRIDAAREDELSQGFRRERKRLENLLSRENPADEMWTACFEALRQRSAKLRPIIVRLKKLEAAGRLGDAPAPKLSTLRVVPSYIHMHLNRLLRSAHQEQELVIYDALLRLCESEAARGKAIPSSRAGA